MRRGYYSAFWLAGGLPTSPEWAARDVAPLSDDAQLARLELLPMSTWLGLRERTRRAIAAGYYATLPKSTSLRR